RASPLSPARARLGPVGGRTGGGEGMRVRGRLRTRYSVLGRPPPPDPSPPPPAVLGRTSPLRRGRGGEQRPASRNGSRPPPANRAQDRRVRGEEALGGAR